MNYLFKLSIIFALFITSCNTSKPTANSDQGVNETETAVQIETTGTEDSRPPRGERGDRGARSEENKAKYLAMIESLELNQEQKVQFQAINENFQSMLQKKREEARASGGFEGMREEMRTIRDQQNGAIKNLLTDSQYEIYSAFLEKQKAARAVRGDRRGGRG